RAGAGWRAYGQGARGERRHVRAGVGFRQRKGRDRFALCRAARVATLLRLGAVEENGAAAKPLHGEREVGEPRVEREDLAQDRERAHVEARVLRRAVGEEPGRAEVLHKASAHRVRVVVMRVGETLDGEALGGSRELGVPRLEERPLQVREPVHASAQSLPARVPSIAADTTCSPRLRSSSAALTRSLSSLFWLSFHLPMIFVTSISMPTIIESIRSMYSFDESVIFHGLSAPVRASL